MNKATEEKKEASQTKAPKKAAKSEEEKPSLLKKVVRSPFYFFSFVLLFFVTAMVFIAMFTNNWMKTASSLVKDEYYTFGLWFSCRVIRLGWYKNQFDRYCSTADYTSIRWVHAAQVFYTISAALNLVAFSASIFGLCKDCAANILAIPSFIFWILITSSSAQLIAISVYGGKGAGDYTEYEPDYSMIIASVALGLNCLCALLFFVELLKHRNKQNPNINS